MRARVSAGLLEGPVRATAARGSAALAARAYNCFTLAGRTPSTRTIANGYRFSAKVDAGAGTLVWCKLNPRPLHPDTGPS